MSWDVSLIKECKCCNKTDEIEVGNYTYNVSKMYNLAMDCTISDLHGLIANDVTVKLLEGINHMKQYSETYIQLNPANGYGNYEGAVKFLEKIYDACMKNPDYKIDVN